MKHVSHLFVVSLLAPCAIAQSLEPYRVVDGPSGAPSFFDVLAIRDTVTPPGQSYCSFVTPNGGDCMFELGWFYRVAGDPTNSAFHDGPGSPQGLSTPPQYSPGPPETGVNQGSMSVDWTNVNNRGFDASWMIGMNYIDSNRAITDHGMSIHNPGAGTLDLELIVYLDCDVDGSFPNTDPRTSPGDRFLVQNPFTGGFVDVSASPSPSGWEVDTFFSDLDGRIASNAYDLANTGLPFPNEDWSGAFQWTLSLGPGETADVTLAIGRDTCANPAGTQAAVTNYGNELGGAIGAPRINSLPPLVGLPFDVLIGNGPTQGVASVMIGNTPTAVPLCGIELLVVPFVTVSVPLDLVGSGVLELVTPCDSNLFGFSVYMQAWIIDATSPSTCFPLVHSDGLQATFGQ